MKLSEMKKFDKVAEIGVTGYAVEESGCLRVWNGNEWIGNYRLDGENLVKIDQIAEMLKSYEKFGIK